MKNISLTFLAFFVLLGCKNETKISEKPAVTKTVSKDSLVRIIQKNWKFNVSVSNPAVQSKLNNWDEWQNYVNQLTIKPNNGLANLMRKSKVLVEKTSFLKNNIPSLYNKPETKARIALLETNVQNLDMLLELEPLNAKEINTLLGNIQKNTNSLLNQFNEFEVKAKIPKELGEDKLIQPIDTIKRATLNAIPKE